MKRECRIDLESCDGDHTNLEVVITKSPNEEGCLILDVGGHKYELLINELEEACRVMRA